ncbi:hypothetical protein [Nocardia altamirensis]|uniref:hypothetical protein n=1 Tax=Nocardia altamirensis TaxID=472158 RepID=UPI0008404511|nr:hypothetical protein [Nocardia altamirensis]
MADQLWQVHARAALEAAIDGDYVEGSLQMAQLLDADESGTAVIQAALLWMDTLLAMTPLPSIPWRPPPASPDMSAGQIWALRLLTARANDDSEAGEKLFAEAASADFDHLIECLMSLLSLVGMQLGGRRGTAGQ